MTIDQKSLLEQWASLVATQVINGIDQRIGLGDGDAAVIAEEVIAAVAYEADPERGGDLLRRAIK